MAVKEMQWTVEQSGQLEHGDPRILARVHFLDYSSLICFILAISDLPTQPIYIVEELQPRKIG